MRPLSRSLRLLITTGVILAAFAGGIWLSAHHADAPVASSVDGLLWPDPPALRPFALLLRRAASQALCEAAGVAFPEVTGKDGETLLPAAPLDADDLWIPALARVAQSEADAQRALMGRLADRFLQPVPARWGRSLRVNGAALARRRALRSGDRIEVGGEALIFHEARR